MALLPSVPHWFIARKNLPPKNFKEFIAYMKDGDGKVTAASVGAGGSSAVCGYYFGKATGTSTTLVPYRGGAPALQDIVAGNVDMMCDLAANSLAQVQGRHHQGLCGDVEEALVRGARSADRRRGRRAGSRFTNWLGAYAPKGTPKDIVLSSTRPSMPRWPIRRPPAHRRSGHGDSAAGAADAGGVRGLSERPRWTNGARSSASPASRCNEAERRRGMRKLDARGRADAIAACRRAGADLSVAADHDRRARCRRAAASMRSPASWPST